jgi:hypothetical protein
MVQEGEFREEPEARAGTQALTKPNVIITEYVPRPSLAMIEHTKQDLRILQQLVSEVLMPTIDWGHIPGVPGSTLFDCGAQKIFAAFNVFPGERRILKLEDDETRIVACVEVPIIDRGTGKIVATGVGAASTLETKHKYRWIEDPKSFGLDDFTISSLKTKVDNGKTLYRVPNPEHGELLNTIIQMSSKRAEADAAKSLPGVGTVLKQLFTNPGAVGASVGKEDIWGSFWGEMRRLGISNEALHEKFGSVKQYVEKSGKPPADALKALLEELRKSPPPEPKKSGADPSVQQLWADARKELDGSAITALMVANWWSANKSIVVTLEDFKKEQPPETLPRDAAATLKQFIKAIRTYTGARG